MPLQRSKSRQWASGQYHSVALLDVPDALIEERTGLPLVGGVEEGLGRWKGVGGELENGVQVELLKYLESPQPHFELRIDQSVSAEFGLERVLSVLGVSNECVVWKSSEGI